jgi:hypothetical protein
MLVMTHICSPLLFHYFWFLRINHYFWFLRIKTRFSFTRQDGRRDAAVIQVLACSGGGRIGDGIWLLSRFWRNKISRKIRPLQSCHKPANSLVVSLLLPLLRSFGPSLFCGPDYDEINKTSLSFWPKIHNFKSMTKIRKSS